LRIHERDSGHKLTVSDAALPQSVTSLRRKLPSVRRGT
jgi:hypothetical protein